MEDLDQRFRSYRTFPQVNYLITSWLEYKQGCARLQVTPDPALLQRKIRECWETIKEPFLLTGIECYELMVFETFVMNETDILERAAARSIPSLTTATAAPLSLAAAATLQQQQAQFSIPSTPVPTFAGSGNVLAGPLASYLAPAANPLLGTGGVATAAVAAVAPTTTTALPTPLAPPVTPAASTAEVSWTSGEDEPTLQRAVHAGMQAAQLALPDSPPVDSLPDCFSMLSQNPAVVISSDDSLMSTLPDGPGPDPVVTKPTFAKASRTSKHVLAGKFKTIHEAAAAAISYSNKASAGKRGGRGNKTPLLWMEPFGMFQQGNKKDAFAAAAAEFSSRYKCEYDPHAKLIRLGGPRDRQNYRCTCLPEQASPDPVVLRFQRRPEDREAGLAVFVKDHLYERTWEHFCDTADDAPPSQT